MPLLELPGVAYCLANGTNGRAGHIVSHMILVIPGVAIVAAGFFIAPVGQRAGRRSLGSRLIARSARFYASLSERVSAISMTVE
jgi:hypothetical protein